MDKDLNEFHRKEIQAVEKHMRRCSDTISHKQNACQNPFDEQYKNKKKTSEKKPVCEYAEKLESVHTGK